MGSISPLSTMRHASTAVLAIGGKRSLRIGWDAADGRYEVVVRGGLLHGGCMVEGADSSDRLFAAATHWDSSSPEDCILLIHRCCSRLLG